MTKVHKDIDSAEYHLWTDVLHACALSEQANNAWDRSSYVRWTIITAWTVLEMLFRKSLENERIGYNFKRDVNETIDNLGLPKVNWGEKGWQLVLELKEKRKIYVHTKLEQEDLFLDSQIARRYVDGVRESIKLVHTLVSKPIPEWVYLEQDEGWDEGNDLGVNMIIERQGARMEDPSSLIISFVYKGKEYITEVLPEHSDYEKVALEIVNLTSLAITTIRVSQGGKVVWEKHLRTRGSF